MNENWHWLYFVAGIVFIMIEVLSFTFYFLPLGISAIITGICALFISNIDLHVFIFVVSASLIFIFLSKWRKSKFLKPLGSQFIAGVVGQYGIVIEKYNSSADPGKIKIFSDVWQIHWDSSHSKMLADLNVGDNVKVIAMKGNKVIVEKV